MVESNSCSMGRDADGRTSSQGGTSTAKDKALFSSKSRMHKLQDRLRGDRITEKPWSSSSSHKGEPSRLVHSCPPKITGSRIQKVPRRVEDLVKYMSEVPAYLQLLDKTGITNQEKALNMGVLDWGHLREWTEGRKSSRAENFATDSRSFHASSSAPPPLHGTNGSSDSKQLANILDSSVVSERIHQLQNTSTTSDGSTCSSQEINTSLSISTECEIPSSSEIKDGHSQTRKLTAATGKADGLSEDIVEKTRESFQGLNWVSRSWSLTEIEVRKPAKGSAHLDDNGADNTSATSRARRSPLRRMLDPLLKPRMSLRCPDSLANSPASFVRRLSFSDKPRPKGESEKQIFEDSSPSGRATSSSRNSLQYGKHVRSKAQALLRVAWKNESPLLTFSTNDDDILVATRKRLFSADRDVGYAYTFYYIHERGKKNGWRNQGSKNKKQQEVFSKLVARMSVSESSGGISATRFSAGKFVLTGAEIRPSASETPKFLPESEIAAILIRSPKDVADVRAHREEQCSVSRPGSKNSDLSFSSNIVAILPSEIHGSSESGSPSSLVKRWKSGGFCDCGGWDVGCSISVLTESMEATTNHTELFTEGQSRKNGPIFSLVPFKEDIFAVDFEESISMLQAFSICVAILHRRKPSSIAKSQSHLQQHKFPGDNGNALPASYGTYHPPLSPVGRA